MPLRGAWLAPLDAVFMIRTVFGDDMDTVDWRIGRRLYVKTKRERVLTLKIWIQYIIDAVSLCSLSMTSRKKMNAKDVRYIFISVL
jgi:hypothetical protein